MISNYDIVCSGCSACANICPRKCIAMLPDREGFLYPKINNSRCIGCNRCEKVCQAINPINNNSEPRAYAAFNKNDAVRAVSSSGGVFTAFAEEIIERGGIVFGAAFVDDFSVQHIYIDKKEDIYKLRGSKYLQSTIGNAYIDVKKHLTDGKLVLFSGTPCQIDGLYHYLGKDYSNLYTQDLICHGVPSPLVWKKYLEYRCKESGDTLDYTRYPEFRNKDEGWKDFSLKIYYSNGHIYRKKLREDLYMGAFLSNICLRLSCYDCKSKSLSRNSDITLADFWGIDEIDRSMFDNKGTSLVFVNTKKGEELMRQTEKKLIMKETDIHQAVSYNSAAYKSVNMNITRNKFMKLIQNKPFDKALILSQKEKFSVRLKGVFKEYMGILRHRLKITERRPSK